MPPRAPRRQPSDEVNSEVGSEGDEDRPIDGKRGQNKGWGSSTAIVPVEALRIAHTRRTRVERAL